MCIYMLYVYVIGHDSVEGLPGGVLNYDEVVVYNEHQAVPSFLIIYSLPPTP